MLIYAVADIHADPERIERIRAVVSVNQPDVVVVAGDIINYIQPAKTFNILNNLSVPVLAVRGNSDPAYIEKYFNRFSNLTSLHLNRVMVQSIPFIGLSGTIPLPFRNRVRFREQNLMNQAYPLIDSQTVFVVHPPPWGSLDQVMGRFHSGSQMVRDLVEQRQPRLLLCGHIHEAAGVSNIGETTVVNCSIPKTGKGMMIELGQVGKLEIEMV
ncbi:MAG: phosphoesterase [Desulfobacteraceae bacterium]|nr:metallophosphoesterase family protein [Desulfobacteraceae bacterium]MBC2755337.1 phosphoesterase [Desulfobacteraceae bacterium]